MGERGETGEKKAEHDKKAAEGKTVEGEAVLRVAAGRGSLSRTEQRGSVHIGQRAFLEDVDIPSGAAVAWTTIGGDTRPLGTEESGTAVTQKCRVQLGRDDVLAAAAHVAHPPAGALQIIHDRLLQIFF